MNSLIYALSNLIYPQKCCFCETRLNKDETLFCSSCLNKLVFLDNVCDFCGSHLNISGNCHVCSDNNFHFKKARSLYEFSPEIKSIIHELKYSENLKAAKFLAENVFEYLKKFKPFPQLDYIIPVPLHAVKKRKRGYNQSERITYYLSKKMKIPQIKNLITRNRFTDTQTQLNKSERKKNVTGAFTLRNKIIDKKVNILIVDDVFTTGSTLNAISKLLENRGFTGIYVLTIARA